MLDQIIYVWNIKGLHHQDAKESEKMIMWQKFKSFAEINATSFNEKLFFFKGIDSLPLTLIFLIPISLQPDGINPWY